MENLNEFTETQLLKMVNDTKKNHERLKKEIIDKTIKIDDEMKKATNDVNHKISLLDEIENNYVKIIEELNNRDVI